MPNQKILVICLLLSGLLSCKLRDTAYGSETSEEKTGKTQIGQKIENANSLLSYLLEPSDKTVPEFVDMKNLPQTKSFDRAVWLKLEDGLVSLSEFRRQVLNISYSATTRNFADRFSELLKLLSNSEDVPKDFHTYLSVTVSKDIVVGFVFGIASNENQNNFLPVIVARLAPIGSLIEIAQEKDFRFQL
jgi:hypothetical protein